jgi:outer membrane lipoprotein LolB
MTSARVLLLAAALLVSACAEMQFRRPEAAAQFELAGRIAVRFRDESSSGNFAWRHGAQEDEVLITTPLGQGIARIVREGESVTLTDAEGREHRATDAETLTEQVLGFRLPLAGLAEWIRARVGPGPSQIRKDEAGRIVELEQAGWKIEYLGWQEDGRLPARMRLRYPGLELRIAIAQWK